MSISRSHKIVIAAIAVSGVLMIGAGVRGMSSQGDLTSSISVNTNTSKSIATNLASKVIQDSVSHDIEFSSVDQIKNQTPPKNFAANDLARNSKLQTEQPIVNLDSIAALMSHLNETPPDLIDFDSVVALINSSNSAFDYISQEYLSSSDPQKQRVLLNALNNTSNQARVGFALNLAQSSDLKQRRRAYSWLSRSTSTEDIIYDTLVSARTTKATVRR